MQAMFRPLRRLPAHALNGFAVSLGVGLVLGVVGAFGSAAAAQAATAGAVYASIPHLVDRARRAARRALAGGLVGSVTALLITALTPVPVMLNLGIAFLVFAAMMTMAWGQRAGPISFTVILAIVFSLAAPSRLSLPHAAGFSLLGAAIYAGWAHLSTWLIEPRFRTLAIAAALGASARLLRSRAAVLEERAAVEQEANARWQQIDEETRLAALLQSARYLVFPGADRPQPVAHAQLLLRAIELRDLLLTSRLDLDLLGDDELAHEIRGRLARSLRANAVALDDAEAALETRARTSFDRARALKEVSRILDERDLPADDPRLRLLPALASRQQHLVDLIVSIHEQLQVAARAESPLSSSELGPLTAEERWPLRELTRSFSLQSPVFRHAVRSGVALTAAHALGSALPWATHPHWIMLSVAVVLRGTFAQTLSRRNERILGTAAGCLFALGFASFASETALTPIFLLAAGTAHAFVNVRYTLTAAAATVMALLQTRSLSFITPVVLIERLADTIIGAGFAWGFSYVLPSWSRRTLPQLVENTLHALQAYTDSALSRTADAAAGQRLAREHAYGSLETLISIVRLGSVEPERVRPPLPVLVSFIDHAQSLMAHLSSLRLLLLRRAEQLQGEQADRALDETRLRLAKRLEVEAAPYSMSPRIQPLHLELPSVPAEHSAFPWLLRRLNVSIYEADRTGETGRAALSLLRERAAIGQQAQA
jgi:uncharacterized membrane protein YccC